MGLPLFADTDSMEKTGRIPGSFMQVHEGGAVHILHYQDRTLCGMVEAWIGGYRTFDEDEVTFSEHQMPSGVPCKACVAAASAEIRRIYRNS